MLKVAINIPKAAVRMAAANQHQKAAVTELGRLAGAGESGMVGSAYRPAQRVKKAWASLRCSR
ncbi:hypothetical protein TUM20983_47850 [Mycobacterium antarcticum]|nr:hypothetical protein TUM20983_47850 [Mycolicibacterium sp. TUM20983]